MRIGKQTLTISSEPRHSFRTATACSGGQIWWRCTPFSDGATAMAYFSIPAAILVVPQPPPGSRLPGLAALFATFILACGLTHVADLTTLWWPI